MTYELHVGNVTRHLPVMNISDDLAIASFVMLGDVELVEESAKLLAERLPEVDYIVTAEAKGIPLVQEMARVMGMKRYVVARKSIKAYMENIISCSVQSITTQKLQTLYLDGKEAELLRGKKIALVDDVISTGESLRALETLAEQCGAEIVVRAAVLAEGDAQKRTDIIFLEKLPLFDAKTGKML